jgi:hypothetical protein
MEAIFTAEQAKEARSKTRLSQGKVAADLGINRTYLSLFEGGKYVFEDSVLESLRSYYEQQGYDFGDTDPPAGGRGAVHQAPQGRGSVRVMDGFQVVAAMQDEEAEMLLSEYVQNRVKINELCAQKPKDDWFGEVHEGDLHKRQQQILTLMARNFTIVEQLHGHETVLPCYRSEEDAQKETVGDYLKKFFADVFGFQDDEDADADPVKKKKMVGVGMFRREVEE